MIDFATELQYLMSAPGDEASLPTRPLGVQIDVRCAGDAPAVLDRVRELLVIVMRHRLDYPSEDEPYPFVVDEAEWAVVLPSWFVERTALCSLDLPEGGRTLGGWLYWFLSGGADRPWRWVSASVVSPTRITVVLDNDLPLLWVALDWAFLAAGAASAEF